jgi:ABC-type transporter Mla maintaining outer membrane lipid asymmetry permease subunit MlaE
MRTAVQTTIPFERYRRQNIGSLLTAVFSVALRFFPRVFTGRVTILEREAARQMFAFLSGTALSSAFASYIYGLATTYGVITSTSRPEAFESLVLPQFGGVFIKYVIPFAIANLVVVKGAVGMTSDIASMRLSQEIDALEAVDLDPAEMVFAPRALALIVSASALAVVGVYAACLGAWTVVWIAARMEFAWFIAVFASSITSAAMLLTVAKLALTALVTAIISGYFGFRGAKAEQGLIGNITTSAVAAAVFSTIIVNLLLSLLAAACKLE